MRFSLDTLAARNQGLPGRIVLPSIPAFVFCVIFASPTAASENIALFRLDTGLMIPHGPDLGTYGVGASIEPKFTILDPLVLGLRLEGAAHLGGKASKSSVSLSQWASTGILAKVEYYLFPLNSIRPFAGFGAGRYTMGGQNISANSGGGAVSQAAGSYFGVAPQLGIELGGFRIVVGYNLIVDANLEVRQTAQAGMAPPPPTKSSRNFVYLELGGRFGGSRKDPKPPTNPQPMTTPAVAPTAP